MKRAYIILILFVQTTCQIMSQEGWTWTELPNMPEAVSNNAVTSAYSGDSLCVYSFCGIDETKQWSGIHLKSWKYNTVSQVWTSLPDVPDFQGKIAASAHTIDNKIYVIGGYYVYENLNEESSDDVHVFDPETNSWLTDGANIPTPIDDHVYGTWRDSLIYIVTGWSNSQNVRDVQIYDANLDQWQQANDLPITNTYNVFGASGAIVNDTLFYLGGVNNSFNTMSRLRRGVINPENPTEVNWDVVGEAPSGDAYRSACAIYQNRMFFIGGSDDGYNFDAISYNLGTGVEAQNRIVSYYSQWEAWEEGESPYGIMDLRGISRISDNSWIICGGISAEQEVSNKTFFLQYDPSVGINDHSIESEIRFQLNRYTKTVTIKNLALGSHVSSLNSSGLLMSEFFTESSQLEVNYDSFSKGLLLITVQNLGSANPEIFRFIND